MDFVICILLVSLCAVRGLQIMESSQKILARPGTSHELLCTVDSTFDGDTMVVFWIKVQNRGVVEEEEVQELTVSSGPILSSDFKSTTWYNLALSNVGANKRYTLQLNSVRPEESGEYICRVEDNQNVIRGEITYTVNVYDAIDDLVVHGVANAADVDTDPNMWQMDSWVHTTRLEYGDSNEGFYACLAKGVYPQPNMRVYIGDNLISGLGGFRTFTQRTLEGDTLGQQKYMANFVVYTDNFPFDASNDEMDVVCEAVVEDSAGAAIEAGRRVTSTLMLQTRPELANCSSAWHTPIGTENFQIYCDVFSKEQPSRVEFYGSNTGDRVRLGDPGQDDFRVTMQTIGIMMWRVILTISEMDPDYFQGYKLTVENAHGPTEKDMTIIVGTSEVGPVGAASLLGAQSMLVLLLVAMAATRIC